MNSNLLMLFSRILFLFLFYTEELQHKVENNLNGRTLIDEKKSEDEILSPLLFSCFRITKCHR